MAKIKEQDTDDSGYIDESSAPSGNPIIKDSYLDRYLGQKIIERNQEESANHKSSGKLSAGSLGDPLQWQILRSLGISSVTPDEYTLRKFKRGKDVEDWFTSEIPDQIGTEDKKQEVVFYRDVIGLVDATVDTTNWDFKMGIIPLEVKSVSNAKFKRIEKTGADENHKLQAGLYALAKGVSHFAISYIATDDYRVITYIYNVAPLKSKIDSIIDRFEKQKKTGIVPVFIPEQKWQADKKYNKYPDWASLSQEECNKKLEEINKIK